MSQNPQVTIALAFVLTFLIGVGAGYLLRGEMQVPRADREAVSSNETSGDWRTVDAYRGERGERRPGGRMESRTDADRVQDNEEGRPRSDRDHRERDLDQNVQNREMQPESQRRPSHARIRARLKNELELTDESAEKFFNILDQHRDEVKRKIVDQQQIIREQYQELGEQLEEELSEVLTEKQMELWKEKFAPRMERHQRSRIDGL